MSMKVLLTGANGFVGSHILDRLRAREIATVILLRPSSDTGFIRPYLPHVEVHRGSVNEPESLAAALAGVTHVIHCAGCTKALSRAEFDRVNRGGTRTVVEAVNVRSGQIRRLVHVSSLAAVGPATAQAPAREENPPKPVSEYGKSKLAAEEEVRHRVRTDFVILRPPAVYGPRDREFLRLFRSVKTHVRPGGNAARQPLSLVYVKDLAEVAVDCLTHPAATRGTYFVASPDVVTLGQMAAEIAALLDTWTLPAPLPTPVLWAMCVAQEMVSRLTHRASVLSLQKFPELKAPGWVCDARRLRDELGCVCATSLRAGLTETREWYEREGWL